VELIIACKGAPLSEVVNFAVDNNAGIEVKAFTSPIIFHSDWHGLQDMVKKQLNGFSGKITMHGMFNLGLINWNRISLNQMKADYKKSLEVAEEIGASFLVVHSTYMPGLTSWKYKDWLNLQVDLWGTVAEFAGNKGITLTLENIVDEKPDSIIDVIDQVNSPYLKVCLDFGHLNLISSQKTELEWIEAMGPRLVYTHIHNNNGRYDSHSSIENGLLDYNKIFAKLIQQKTIPGFAVEVDTMEGVKESMNAINRITKELIPAP
jgi:sugar phosphate isomerase/epimerase